MATCRIGRWHWPYTDLADERLSRVENALRVTHDADADDAFKIGAPGADEWAACVLDDTAFIKEFAYDPAATYPDRDSAVEVYTNDAVLELETLGPLETVEPGSSAVHTETWRVIPALDEATERVPPALAAVG